MRNKMMKFQAFLMIFFGFMSLSASADAPAFGPLEIRGLESHSGRTLNVFLVSGRENALGTKGQSLIIRSLKSLPGQYTIPSNGKVQAPAIAVLRGGFDVVNYLVLVITSNSSNLGLFLKNPDGSLPKDPRLSNGDASSLESTDFQYIELRYEALSKIRTDSNSTVIMEFNTLNN